MGVASGSSLEELEAMLQAADSALYIAKHHGRNRVEVVEVKDLRTGVAVGAR
jgi:PleD family two-component response regulator